MFKSNGAASSETPKKAKNTDQGSLLIALLPLVILYVAAITLISLTRSDLSGTIPYWETFLPVVAFISLLSGFGPAYVRDQPSLLYVLQQALHWGILIGLLWLLHTQGVRASLNEQEYLIMMLYLLGLGSLLAGLHMDWKFAVFGAFMVFCTFVLSSPENTALLGTIGDTFGITNAQEHPMTFIAITGCVAFLASTLILIGTRGAIMSKRAAAARA
ncbi:hypothetical protein CKO25_04905 [Thiocapsa imhoffii]|uniref:Uncharacterized protein n=1 Tax=Thiocapsa imhoffii TaxID=382777 RepID=A0A9X0WGD5_9GAMM|nr:hypothetical protein [Thiocapsa imhoffii]